MDVYLFRVMKSSIPIMNHFYFIVHYAHPSVARQKVRIRDTRLFALRAPSMRKGNDGMYSVCSGMK